MIEKAEQLLSQYFGYPSFRRGQKEIIENVLAGKHTAGILPTGGGKSICYQIPACILSGVSIVISPLISLMKDQVDSLTQVGIPAAYINSSLTSQEITERIDKTRNEFYKILYISPERLESDSFRNIIKDLPISLIAIDEAHCISQWGHDFRPSYMKIFPLIKQLSASPVVLALTATATPIVKKDICSSLKISEEDCFVTGFERENLQFKVVKGQNRSDFIRKYVDNNKSESGIVYASTRKDVDQIYEQFKRSGVKAGKYHAGLSDVEREKHQDLFLNDQISVMVASNAFGMGIDKSNVRYVLHYQLPKNMESYYQEAGRAGRDGLISECILLFSPQDIQLQRFLIDQNQMNDERKNQELVKLQQMADYCYTENCLQRYIQHYFGEIEHSDKCGKCSSCTDDRTAVDVTIEAQMVLSCVIRTGERFGKSIISQVLTGSSNKKVKQLEFDKLSTYGILKDRSMKSITEFIDFLTSEQLIGVSGGQYPILFVTNKGKEVLLGKQDVLKKEKIKIQSLESNGELFEKLRALRKEISQEENVPPFVVFSDVTLREMCLYQPKNEDEFLEVKGVGLQKKERYGSRFIEVIQKYLENDNLSMTTEN
ncbi:DNA helicase RecQ [Metabacillus arenae]|uniref:DNA helicase RecQ n=1 Tax=Metabacillus arenae TaxID=2771434 RepID=A0A926RZE0_9BACI|nr:DNA helicase RecQ [Metabacillus arenae]MBD1378964.1 DNA helicase RecQ [Metabacillus arenae]